MIILICGWLVKMTTDMAAVATNVEAMNMTNIVLSPRVRVYISMHYHLVQRSSRGRMLHQMRKIQIIARHAVPH